MQSPAFNRDPRRSHRKRKAAVNFSTSKTGNESRPASYDRLRYVVFRTDVKAQKCFMAGVIRQFTISGQVTLSLLQKKKEKNIRVPRRDLSTRDSSTAPLLISFLIVKRIRLLPRQRNRSRITFESFFFRTRFLPLVDKQFQSQVSFK